MTAPWGCRECHPQTVKRHLETVLSEYLAHHNFHRPHLSLGQCPPAEPSAIQPVLGDPDLAKLRRTDRLGGLVHEHQMVA